MSQIDSIRTEAVPRSPLDGDGGQLLYEGVADHVFGTAGDWAFQINRARDFAWLSPRPTREDLPKVYKHYYTHGNNAGREPFHKHFGNSDLASRLRLRINQFLRTIRLALRTQRLGYESNEVRWYHHILAFPAGLLPSYRDASLLEVACLPAGKTGKLLDVGCGSGVFMEEMRKVGWSVSGVDPDPNAVACARAKLQLDVRQGSLAEAVYEPNTFDCVHLAHVIEHVADPTALLKDCLRVLRPGGLLVVTTPNIDSYGHSVFGRHWRGLEVPRHLVLFNPESIRRCMQKAGFESIHVRSSSRVCRGIWYGSLCSQNADQGKQTTLFHYLYSYIWVVIEDGILLFNKFRGEELVATSKKP
jgi:2-polyprenyl-3-methyl-5-hydroxy-6-metoxy-1,4-benzoquinol methylase